MKKANKRENESEPKDNPKETPEENKSNSIVLSISSTGGGIAGIAAALVAWDRWHRYLPPVTMWALAVWERDGGWATKNASSKEVEDIVFG